MKNKKSIALGFMLGVAACVLLPLAVRVVFPTPLQALPIMASTKEEIYDSGFLPDFSYKLEAAVQPDDFDRFVRRMRFPAGSRQSATLYVVEEPEKEYRMSAEYRNGTLYFEESKY
jgi:hypothetical protein